MASRLEPRVLVPDGILFPEGPRWINDRLWMVDMHGHKVLTVDLKGSATTVVDYPDRPSGMGVLPDGSIICSSMRRRVLEKVDVAGNRELYADLNDVPGHSLNDMVIDGRGRAYVGNRSAVTVDRPDKMDTVISVELGGRAHRIAADGLTYPNGCVVTPDNKTFILNDRDGLWAFTIDEDGGLRDRRLFAETRGRGGDGICLDAEGAIWVASPGGHLVYRVLEGGKTSDEIPVPEDIHAIAVALGGPDRRLLFMVEARVSSQELQRVRLLDSFEGDLTLDSKGRVRVVEVEVPGAGWP